MKKWLLVVVAALVFAAGYAGHASADEAGANTFGKREATENNKRHRVNRQHGGGGGIWFGFSGGGHSAPGYQTPTYYYPAPNYYYAPVPPPAYYAPPPVYYVPAPAQVYGGSIIIR